jgi:hypothetical protein
MDESSDADEVCSGGGGGRYSVDSSPRAHRAAAAPLYRYANAHAHQQQHHSSYYSSDGYSDLSSSRDTALPRPRTQPQQQARAAAAYAEEEEEYSDSAGSSEFSTQPTAARRSNGVAGYASEYSHTGPARREASNAVPKARVAAASNKPSNSRN